MNWMAFGGFLIVLLGGIGYLRNIWLAWCTWCEGIDRLNSGFFLFRLIGIALPPVGAVLGYMPSDSFPDDGYKYW